MSADVPHPADRHAFPLLDGARGLVALAVLGFHAAAALHLPGVFQNAYLGVDFFFLMSGFVIAHAYEGKLRAGGYLLRFAQVRLVRLYPMIALGTLIGLVLIPMHHPATALAAGLLMIPRAVGPLGDLVFPLNAALWSLFFELLANLVFALTVRRAGLRTLVVVCLVSLPLAALGGTLHVGWETDNFWWGFPRTAFSFSLGLILHRLHREGRLPRLDPAAPWLLAALAAVMVLPWPFAAGGLAWTLVCAALLFPATVVALAQARVGARAARLCARAGDLSYPLYALHVPIVMSVGGALLATHGALPGRVAAMIGLMAAVAGLATLAARFVDAPARAWLGALLLRRRAPVMAARVGST